MTARAAGTVVRRRVAGLGREEAARLTRLSGRRATLALPGGRVLEDGACDGPAADGPWARLEIGLDGAPAELWCLWALIELFLDGLESGRDAGGDVEVAGLLLELALDGEVRALAAHGIDAAPGCLTRHDAAPPLPSAGHAGARALVLVAAGRRWPLALRTDEAGLDALLARWPVAPSPAEEVPLGATLRLGATTLPAGVLRSLGPGDTVFPQVGLAPAGGRLVVAGDRLAPAAWDGTRWVLEHAPARADREAWLGMADEMEGAGVADEDDIPLRLCFDLGRLEMTLGELRRLGPGAVLELPGPGGAVVALTVGGRRIGEGELVEVDGRAAVRVLGILGRG